MLLALKTACVLNSAYIHLSSLILSLYHVEILEYWHIPPGMAFFKWLLLLFPFWCWLVGIFLVLFLVKFACPFRCL